MVGMNTPDIPKFHSLTHYALLIRKFGTMDNYNMEQLEHFYIDFTKNVYWSANTRMSILKLPCGWSAIRRYNDMPHSSSGDSWVIRSVYSRSLLNHHTLLFKLSRWHKIHQKRLYLLTLLMGATVPLLFRMNLLISLPEWIVPGLPQMAYLHMHETYLFYFIQFWFTIVSNSLSGTILR